MSALDRKQLQVLFIEDTLTDAKLVARELQNTGYTIEWERVETAVDTRAALDRTSWDLIICDWSMPQFSALAALSIVREKDLDIPFIIVSGTVGEEWAVEAMRMGAHDYVLKDSLARLAPAVERELRERTMRQAYGRAAHALQTSQNHYRRMVETTSEGVWTLDATSNTTFMNVRMAQMLGYEANEVLGMPLFTFIDESAHANIARHLSRHRAGIAGQLESKLKRRDGTAFWALIESTPIRDETNRYDGMLAMVTDLTERKQVETALLRSEAQLRQAAKMEAIGQLAGGVAHDFNNLLSVILSYSVMIAKGLKPDDPIRAELEQIRLAGEQAAELTRQLLAFSRQQVLQLEFVDLNDVVAQSERMLRRLIGENIELTVKKGKRLGTIKVDPSQIQQVVLNLAVNARDDMPHGGKLTIETANVCLDDVYVAAHADVSPGPYTLLAVTDTGTGMDQEVQSRLFEPFFTTKEQGKGTGLGLATVFGIVKQSGGTIWVYSEVGHGTTFKVYFPQVEDVNTNARTITNAPEAETRGGAETILLVEDEPRLRDLVCSILREGGYHVLDAQSGGDALLISEQHPATIHLLLTDVIMPRMSGRQLAERLHLTRPGMPVLYMSGYADNAIIQHGILDSDIAFLQKPITPETLTRKVRQVLDATKRN